MDFSTLLGMAEDNTATKKKNINFSLKVDPAKKKPKDKKLADNVKKFLQKQEKEERKKKADLVKKKSHLLDMRRENSKSVRTMNSMLKRTKSSNKSVIAEARNLRDTNDTLAGRTQCDEDDYGYESTIAKGFYEKLMSQYEASPEDPMDKFTRSGNKKTSADISKTMARVKCSLEQGDENEHKGHKRRSNKQQSNSSTSSSSKNSSRSTISPTNDYNKKDEGGKKSRREKELEAKKKRLALAQKTKPPPSFNDLMKMAQQKSKEPVKIEKKESVKVAEFDRPMTKKEKEEYLREKESRMRKEGKLPATYNKNLKNNNNNENEVKESSSKTKPEKPKTEPPPPPPKPVIKKPPVITGPEFHPAVVKAMPKAAKPSHPNSSARSSSTSSQSRKRHSSSSSSSSKPVKRPARSRSPSPIANSSSSRPSHNRIVSDSEEEEDYDSEMDDFIDDSDTKVDISAEIRKMFGYDRRKFRDEEDFDDRAMENNKFSEVMKEEARSAKIGLMEDLEDMKREEEEKKRKKMKHKSRR